MANIIDYVKEYGGISFKDMPFGEVDSLILSQLSYMNYEKSTADSVNFITTISDLLKIDEFVLINNVWEPEKNIELLSACANSVRFGGVRVANYVNLTEEETEKQFAAMTFKLNDKKYYIAYRGTDASLVGWKEDFNLSYMKKIPSQSLALKYFKKVSKKLKGEFIIGGHSKGGNLALFTGIFARGRAKKSIAAIYDHDGPGFSDSVFKERSLNRILPKVHKTIPQTAVVGLILNRGIPFKVVESRAFGLMQHDPFAWQVEGRMFKTRESTDIVSKYTAKKINDWLKKVDNKKRKLFIDSLYAAVLSTGAKTYFDLLKNKKASAKKIISSINDLDPEVKEMIKSLASEFIRKRKNS